MTVMGPLLARLGTPGWWASRSSVNGPSLTRIMASRHRTVGSQPDGGSRRVIAEFAGPSQRPRCGGWPWAQSLHRAGPTTTQISCLHSAQASRRIRTRPFLISSSGLATRRRRIPVMASTTSARRAAGAGSVLRKSGVATAWAAGRWRGYDRTVSRRFLLVRTPSRRAARSLNVLDTVPGRLPSWLARHPCRHHLTSKERHCPPISGATWYWESC